MPHGAIADWGHYRCTGAAPENGGEKSNINSMKEYFIL
jgi:hypothetical protein